MNTMIRILLIVFSVILMTACGGGGGNSNNSSIGIPSDAARLTSDNADDFARAGLAQIDIVTGTTDFLFKSGSATPAKATVRLAIDQLFGNRVAKRSIADRSITDNCGADPSFGSITYDTTESEGVESGAILFNNCNLFGIIIDGGYTFSATIDDITGAYSVTGNGSLDFSFDTEQFTIEMDFDISGNSISDEFTETFDFSLSGITGGGFLLTTTRPITGVGLDVTDGQLVIYGADNTRVRVTVVGTNLVDIELDNGNGTFVPHSSSVPI